MHFNLALLSSRRHISMLGLIHKYQLGIAPTCLSSFFPRARSTLYNFSDSLSPIHDRQVACHVTPSRPIIFRRSVFALVRVYNKLLADVVSATIGSLFQRRLTALLKASASSDVPKRDELFNIE